MQFIAKGPDIPNRLLQKHEDGEVVLFCGAGVSYPAGLPGFGGLVQDLYNRLGVPPEEVEASALKRGLFDTVISLLESKVTGGRIAVRSHLESILKPKYPLPDATRTHQALLTLGRCSDGHDRLITTNFDRLFEEAQTLLGRKVEKFSAPLLPVPKKKWNGLVYLHGLLANSSPTTLNSLVLSSGDFGIAYLTERWAARFVGELFRSYTVCFVGYSINDPVLRYMMDALAADRLQGENPPEVFAFGSFKRGKEASARVEWEAKNVTPILYQEDKTHSRLHKTLRAWADLYRDRASGKEAVVGRYATLKPTGSTAEDDYVGRVLWAMSDPDGLPAKKFAQFDPLPGLDWLEPMAQQRFGHFDLRQFRVQPEAAHDSSLKFSLMARPSPYRLSALMSLVSQRLSGGRWDHVMHWIAHWLCRHLDDPRLLIWIVNNGGYLNPAFKLMIREELRNKPVSSAMMALWSVVLGDRLAGAFEFGDIYAWASALQRQGFQTVLRLQLLEILRPRVLLSRPYWSTTTERGTTASSISKPGDAAEWKIVLGARHIRDAVYAREVKGHWEAALPDLLWDATLLLRDALELMQSLGGASDLGDPSYLALPSVSDHEQNRHSDGWTFLILLTRDAWVKTLAVSQEGAITEFVRWRSIRFPTFRRLCFFAAALTPAISADHPLRMFTEDGSRWLWSPEVQREVLQLLGVLGTRLSADQRDELEQLILAGPPRAIFRDDLDAESWASLADREIWRRLIRLDAGQGILSGEGARWLTSYAASHPALPSGADEREEFPIWISSGGERQSYTEAPSTSRDIANWLERSQQPAFDKRDNWRDRCKSDFSTCASALIRLSGRDVWIGARWRDALQVWSDGNLLKLSWRHILPRLDQAPDRLLMEADHAICWWLQAQAKGFVGNDDIFLRLVARVLELHRDAQTSDGDRIVNDALNNPIGQTTQALISWWLRQNLSDDCGLDPRIKGIFANLANTNITAYRYGRVFLGLYALTIFRVERSWAEAHLLPLFDWERSEREALAVWTGFLWSPRYHPEFMATVKQQFLAGVTRYAQFGDFAEQFSDFLTYVALEATDVFSESELRKATDSLPVEGKHQAATSLVRFLEGAGTGNADYWNNRISRYFDRIWPKRRNLRSEKLSETFARLAIAAGNSFPSAVEKLSSWLIPVNEPSYIIHRLKESEHCSNSPEHSLELLNLILDGATIWSPEDLRQCLLAIVQARPTIRTDARLIRLDELLRQYGRGIGDK